MQGFQSNGLGGSTKRGIHLIGVWMMNKKKNKRIYLIPLLVIMLGVLVPVLYAIGQQGEDPSISANIQEAEEAEEHKTEDSDQQKQSEEEQKTDAVAADNDSKDSKDSKDSGSTKEEAAKTSNKNSQTESKKSTSSASQSSTTSTQASQKDSTSDKKPDSSPNVQENTGPAAGYMRVSVTIVDLNTNRLYSSAKVDLKDGGSALDALYATGVSCKVRNDGYVYEIKGIAEDHNTGGGWMYSVNGGAPPGMGAASYTIKKGDSILWYYGTFGAQPPKL